MTDEHLTEQLLDQFDQQWRKTPPPQISDFVKKAANEGCHGQDLLSELVKIDLEYRYRWSHRAVPWLDGDQPIARLPRLEDYAAAMPQLVLSADLLMEECRVRSRFATPPDFAELRTRFPRLAQEAKESLQELIGKECSISERSTHGEILAPGNAGASHTNTPVTSGASREDFGYGPQPVSIGRYRVIEPLGRGGFGVVWKAHDPRLLRDVAIKSVAFEVIGSVQRREMLLEEARNAASLHHPGLVTVFDVLEKHGQIHLVMELVDGRPLHRWVKGRRPDSEKIVRLIADVASAVHAAHQGGLVHCDLKPANILVDGHEEIRVADFGLSVRPVTLRGRSTQVFGTPAYMAPEQVSGETGAIDARTDIWALGVVLYQMLHDAFPFRADETNDVFEAILNGHPHLPAGEMDPFSDAARRIYIRCLAKRPEDRFQSAEELAVQLRDLVGTSRNRSTTARLVRQTLPSTSEAPVGRDEVIGLLAAMFGERSERLVTIVGPGGVGKTRVALAVAEQLNADGSRTVCWTDLASVDEPRGLAMAVLRALGISSDAVAGDPIETVADALALRGRLLLILDNAEQIAALVAEAVHRWLQRAPDLSCLVTSQAHLGLSVERRVSLATLPFPMAEEVQSRGASLQRFRQNFPAIDLFVARAEKAGAEIADNAKTIACICSICRQLDGLPLAIELAAARTSVLSLESINQRVLQSTEFLRSRHHDTPQRHRTLHAAIAWAFEGLSSNGKTALFCLSQLPTGCRVGLAELLLENVFPEAATDSIELLQELEDRSLLVSDRSDSDRIEILRSVREFARRWRSRGNLRWSDALWRKYAADVFIEAGRTSRDDVRLQPADGLNVWAVAEWTAEAGDNVEASRLALLANELSVDQVEAGRRAERLERFCHLPTGLAVQLTAARADALLLSGETQSAVTACERFSHGITESPGGANFLRVFGTALIDHGETERGLQQLNAGLEIAEADKDWRSAVQILSKLAHAAWRGGNAARALQLLDRTDSLLWVADDRRVRIDVLRLRGGIDLLQGRTSTALSRLHDAEKLAKELKDRKILRDVLQSMAAVMAELGRFDEALEHSDRAERLSRMFGDRRGIARALNNRALFLIDQGAPEAALAILEDAEKLYYEIGQPDGLAICDTTAGSALLAEGRYVEAKTRLSQALSRGDALEGSVHHAIILGDRAAARMKLGEGAAALHELSKAFDILRLCGAEESPDAFIYRVLQAEMLLQAGHPDAKEAVEAANRLRNQLSIDCSHPRERLRQTVVTLNKLNKRHAIG